MYSSFTCFLRLISPAVGLPQPSRQRRNRGARARFLRVVCIGEYSAARVALCSGGRYRPDGQIVDRLPNRRCVGTVFSCCWDGALRVSGLAHNGHLYHVLSARPTLEVWPRPLPCSLRAKDADGRHKSSVGSSSRGRRGSRTTASKSITASKGPGARIDVLMACRSASFGRKGMVVARPAIRRDGRAKDADAVSMGTSDHLRVRFLNVGHHRRAASGLQCRRPDASPAEALVYAFKNNQPFAPLRAPAHRGRSAPTRWGRSPSVSRWLPPVPQIRHGLYRAWLGSSGDSPRKASVQRSLPLVAAARPSVMESPRATTAPAPGALSMTSIPVTWYQCSTCFASGRLGRPTPGRHEPRWWWRVSLDARFQRGRWILKVIADRKRCRGPRRGIGSGPKPFPHRGHGHIFVLAGKGEPFYRWQRRWPLTRVRPASQRGPT